jgi:hypothetical protein
MRRLLTLLLALWLVLPATQSSAQSAALEHILRYKRVSSTPTLPSGQSFRFFADDLSKLKQNIAGSTPVAADGDVVGKWIDATGNGYDVLSAADDATRPVYHVRSAKGYVQGDGTDDLLTSTTSPNLYGATGTNNYTICMAYRWASPVGSTSAVDESDSASTNSVSSHFRTLGATPANLLASMRGSDGSTNIVTGTFLVGPNDGNDHVVCWVRVGSTLTPYLDGSASSGISVTTTNITLNRINLFGRFRGAATKDSYSNVQLYGVVAWTSDQSANIATIYTVMRALYP